MTADRLASHGAHPLRTFLIVWAGQLASGLGNGMTAFALAVHVYQQTGTASAVALVMLCLFLPAILLRPLGGLLADRLDRRMLIVLGDLGSAFGVLLILVSVLAGALVPWKIYLGVSISSAFVALQNPAYKSSVTDLLPEEHYSRASGLVQLASSAQHLPAPMAAGVLLVTGGLIPILLIDLSTFAVAVVAALAIGRPLVPSRRETPGDTRNGAHHENRRRLLGTVMGELQQGWDAVHSDGRVMAVVVLMSMTTLFLGVLQTLFAPMMLAMTDAQTLGFVQSISASGMLAASLVLGAVGVSRSHDTILIAALILAGLFLSAIGLTTRIGVITSSFFLFFCTLPVINAWGIIGLLSQLGFVAAYALSGLLADRLFTPLLTDRGRLAASVGRVIGTGDGRGMALMLVISGIGLAAAAGLATGPLVSGGTIKHIQEAVHP